MHSLAFRGKALLFPDLSCSDYDSVIRLYTIKVFATSDDPFFDGVPINIWSMIEINVAVICASVPGKRAFNLGSKACADDEI